VRWGWRGRFRLRPCTPAPPPPVRGCNGAVAFTPIFLANLAFARRFAPMGSSTAAFGAKLLGAMVAGALGYAALLTGYRALLLVVATMYLGTFPNLSF
jgi:hypothetical protein